MSAPRNSDEEALAQYRRNQAVLNVYAERDTALAEVKRLQDVAFRLGDDGRRLEAEVERLRAALQDAIETVEGWGCYANEYFQEKWGLEDDLARLRAALTSSEGDA